LNHEHSWSSDCEHLIKRADDAGVVLVVSGEATDHSELQRFHPGEEDTRAAVAFHFYLGGPEELDNIVIDQPAPAAVLLVDPERA
jgi:hypothetical protein